MDKYYKLALVVKEACKKVIEYAEEGSKGYGYLLHVALGHTRTDAEPDCFEIRANNGYLSIHLGDDRGNASYDTDKLDSNIFHKGYVYLYNEQSRYNDDGNEVWTHDCFLSVDILYHALKSLALGRYKSERTRYLDIRLNDNGNLEETKKYLSSVVERFANSAWNDPRTAEEIVAD